MTLLLYLVLGLVALFLLSITPLGRNFRQRMMAKMYTKVQEKYEAHVAEKRKALLSDLSGTVLEIGPGNGVNFQYMPDAVDRWIGIEPNRHMHAELRAEGEKRDIETEFRVLSAEGMELEDDSVDTVLSTLVLCSVPDAAAVLSDIRRILKPGGRFVFLEHVAAPRGTWLRKLQHLLKPLWNYFADGCCPNRDLGLAIRAAGFSEVELDEFKVPKTAAPAVISPHVSGFAVK